MGRRAAGAVEIGLPGGQGPCRVTGSSPAQLLFTIALALTSDYETMFSALIGVGPGDFDRIRSVTAANAVEFVDPPVMP